jgi:hypothetical protein
MILNRYSFLWLGLLLILAVVWIVWRADNWPVWLRVGAPLGAAIVLTAGWLVLHPTATPELSTEADFDRLLASGKPTVLEFFSEY